MTKFTPTKKNNSKEEIKNLLIKGNIIRYDGIEENPIEIYRDRDVIRYLSSMGNIERYKYKNQTIADKDEPVVIGYYSHNTLREAIKDLKNEYNVRKIHCSCSGCCQYATYAIYLD